MLIVNNPKGSLREEQSFKKSTNRIVTPFCTTLIYTFIILSQIQLATSQCANIYRTNNKTIYCSVCDSFFFSCNLVSSTNTQTLNYTKCQSQCCDRNDYDYTSLSMCATIYNNQSQTGLGLSTILIIVFFSVPLLICICLTIKTCYNNHMNQANVIRTRQQLAVNLQQFKIEELGPYYLNRGENCSICLEDNCHIRTRCGHHYHAACLLAWINKKQSCPLCVGETYNPILLYCTFCFKAVTMQNILQGMADDLLQFWGTADSIKCDICNKKQKIDEISLEDIEESSKDMKKQNILEEKKVGQSLQNIRQNERE